MLFPISYLEKFQPVKYYLSRISTSRNIKFSNSYKSTLIPRFWGFQSDLANFEEQAFINYNFLYTKFRARKTVLGARLCTWEIMHIKEQTCIILIITWYSSRKFTKLVLKPLADKNSLSISIICTAPFL